MHDADDQDIDAGQERPLDVAVYRDGLWLFFVDRVYDF